jgi:hypothetical protein
VYALSGDANLAAATPQRYIMGVGSYGLHDKGTPDLRTTRVYRLSAEITIENVYVGWENKGIWELSRRTGIKQVAKTQQAKVSFYFSNQRQTLV